MLIDLFQFHLYQFKMVKAEETPAPVVTEEHIKKLFNIGYRNFIAGDYPEAADALQEVCRFK